MKLKKTIFLLAITFVTWSSYTYPLEVIKAVTEDGRHVVLFPDGTWALKPQKHSLSNAGESSVPQTSKAYLKGGRGAYVIYYDENKWSKGDTSGSDAEFFLNHKNGDGYAMAIFERIPIPLNNLKNIALENARNAAPSAKILEENTKEVNGVKVMVLKIGGTIEGIPFIYYGYYASGNWGTLQLITYTANMLFEEYHSDFTELLNGLSIKK